MQQGDVLKDNYPLSDIIVSNPPYIADHIADTLEVSRFEPHLALKGGTDGLDFYMAMIPKAFLSLNEGGMLAFEIGYDQGNAVKELMEEYFTNVKMTMQIMTAWFMAINLLNYLKNNAIIRLIKYKEAI